MSIEVSPRTSLSCATANTKGSWAELIASTAAATKEVMVTLTLASTGTSRWLVDIGIGGAGAETAIISDLMFAPSSEGVPALSIRLPVGIAAGSRLSARVQSDATAARTIQIVVHLVSGTSSATVATYGIDTTTTRGTQVDPGAVADTKGSYAQITASLSSTVDYFAVVISGRGNSAPQWAYFNMDLATGGAGAESVLVPNMFFNGITASTPVATFIPLIWEFLHTIAAGTRLAARASCDITDATDRLFEVAIYAVSNLPASGGEHSAVF